jgi:hypothetical protein
VPIDGSIGSLDIVEIDLIKTFTVCIPSELLVISSCVVDIEENIILEVEEAVWIWQLEQGADKMESSSNVFVVPTSNS